ncbi:MAG: thioredoxin fold domain-containing protein [Deltaproteobacteria bacterium]|nr:thioredoxin fold domain-containing protein [Deltaproteobacteria bacterium]
MDRLEWKKDIKESLEDVAGGTRLSLLFFHNPHDEASIKMLQETFSDASVVNLIEREFSPVMVDASEAAETVKRYRVDWTPACIVLDDEGAELERFVGYLPPMEFGAQIRLSKGLSAFHLDRLPEAIALFEELIDECRESDLVPEAEYYLGAATYKNKGDAVKIAEVCSTLNTRYPDSIWTKKCSIWSHMRLTGPFVGYDQGGSAGSGAY